MKLLTFWVGSRDRLGALINDDRVVDLSEASALWCRESGPGELLPSSMLALLETGEAGMKAARSTIDYVLERSTPGRVWDGVAFNLAEVRLRPPISRPGKIICATYNFSDSAAEAAASRRKVTVQQADARPPAAFLKAASSLIGDGEPIIHWPQTRELDYEVEVAAVIGRPCRNVSQADALTYVAGYTIFNDVTARDLLRPEVEQRGSVRYCKNMDSFGPLGPVIVTADEIPDPHKLTMRLTVNGQVRQDGSTDMMLFGFDLLISYWSSLMTLQPGDMIASGTPAGAAKDHTSDPQAWFLKPGDEVVLEVEGIGRLRNPIRSPWRSEV